MVSVQVYLMQRRVSVIKKRRNIVLFSVNYFVCVIVAKKRWMMRAPSERASLCLMVVGSSRDSKKCAKSPTEVGHSFCASFFRRPPQWETTSRSLFV